MFTLDDALKAMKQLDAEPSKILPRSTILACMESADLQVQGIAYYMLFDPKYRERIRPQLSLSEYLDFVLPLYERCFREDHDLDWVPTRYTAGWDLANWFNALWKDGHGPRDVFYRIKEWLAGVYISSDQPVRDCIITAVLEHLFESKDIARFFEDWGLNRELAEAYEDALPRP